MRYSVVLSFLIGFAFTVIQGLAGGTVWHFVGGLRNAPSGSWKLKGQEAIARVRARVPVLGGEYTRFMTPKSKVLMAFLFSSHHQRQEVSLFGVYYFRVVIAHSHIIDERYATIAMTQFTFITLTF